MEGIDALRKLPMERLLFPVLIQLIVIILAARVFAVLFRKIGQPAVVGEIAAGLLLGPSLFGAMFPDTFSTIFQPHLPGVPDQLGNATFPKIFSVLSQFGLIFLLFLIGLEFDFSHLRTHGRSALLISLMGILFPFALGFGLAYYIHPHLEPLEPHPDRVLGFALFLGAALSITAIPTLGRIMMELGITRTRLGSITICAAAIDDAAGWILLAAVAATVRSGFEIFHSLLMVAETIGFTLFMFLFARPFLIGLISSSLQRNQGQLGVNTLAVLLVILFGCAIVTNLIGIFAIFGAFILGAVLSDQHEFRLAIGARLRDIVTAFFLPIFFTYTGLRTEIGSLGSWDTVWIAVLVSVVSMAGKFGGCGLAARLSGFSARESVLIGVMMNTRALMELIVINVGYELGVIPKSLFCMLVIMALLTTVMTTPILLWLRHGTELEPFIRDSGFLRHSRK